MVSRYVLCVVLHEHEFDNHLSSADDDDNGDDAVPFFSGGDRGWSGMKKHTTNVEYSIVIVNLVDGHKWLFLSVELSLLWLSIASALSNEVDEKLL